MEMLSEILSVMLTASEMDCPEGKSEQKTAQQMELLLVTLMAQALENPENTTEILSVEVMDTSTEHPKAQESDCRSRT